MVAFNRTTIWMALFVSSLLLVLLLWSSDSNSLVNSIQVETEAPSSEPNPIVQCPQMAREDWKNVNPDEMSPDDLFKYLHFTNHSACQVAYDFGGKVININSRRGIDGQKTVCMDPHIVPEPNKCIIYSLGINNEWSFDKMFEEFGCQIYAFDPSMDMKDGDYTANIHFYQMGILDQNTDQGPNGWKMRSLDSIYKMLETKHGPEAVIDYLKIDVEGAEWSSLPQMLRTGMLDKVKQLGAEVHFSPSSSLADYRNGVKVLKSLEDYGFVRFSSRVNIWMAGHVNILQRHENFGYEITWYNQKFKS